MIPLRLRLHGFLSYQDDVELDFTCFEVACISGSNGAGKSSLLDAITWVLFGQARKRDDALINTLAKSAEVSLDFEYESATYRVVRAKTPGKPTQLHFYILNASGEWKPLDESRVTDTEHKIQSTLRMDYETFTNASFFLQGRADQFAQQAPGSRINILSKILGLEVWEQYKGEAVRQRQVVERQVDGIAGSLREIEAELAEEPARLAQLERFQKELDASAAELGTQKKLVDSLHLLQASVKDQKRGLDAQAEDYQRAQQDLDALTQRLTARQVECQEFLRQVEQAETIEADYQAWQDLRSDLEKWDKVYESFNTQNGLRAGPLREIEVERARLTQELGSLTARREQVRGFETEIPALRVRIEQCEQIAAGARERLDQRGELDERLRALERERSAAVAENPRLMKDMQDLKRRIEQLGQSQGSCPVCGLPLSDEECHHLMGDLETEGKTLAERYRQNQALVGQFDTQVKAVEASRGALSAAETEWRAATRDKEQALARLGERQQSVAAWQAQEAGRMDDLERILAGQDYAQPARDQLTVIDDGLRALGYDPAAHDRLRRSEQTARASETRLRGLEKARASLAPLQREIADLDEQTARQAELAGRKQTVYEQALEAYQAAAAALPDVEDAENHLLDLEEREKRLRMDLGAARQKVAVLDQQRTRKARLSAEREDLELTVSRLKALERAFGKDGVPKLLIEQALPTIEMQANDILDRLSAGAMQVHFATQKDYKDKNREDKMETLEIEISDETGKTRAYELFSGGEAFRVNFAIRLALSRVLAQRAGARLQTLVIDEGFGSQDALGRQRLIEAINLVKPDFAKILVITHLEELKEAFPSRIEVEKGPHGSAVRVV
ncbi:MAG TPA: SMC family ATPase [Anaerolineaceae bacterium]|jgi:exonuclease SbcC